MGGSAVRRAWTARALVVALVGGLLVAAAPPLPVGAAATDDEGEVVSLTAAGVPFTVVEDGRLNGVAVSDDGSRVVFGAFGALDLPCDPLPGTAHCGAGVWMRDRDTGQTVEVSTDAAGRSLGAAWAWGEAPDGTPVAIDFPQISGDGRTVVFQSTHGGVVEVYLKDLDTGALTLVSDQPPRPEDGAHHGQLPFLSSDGGTVAYRAPASPLGALQYLSWDRTTGERVVVADSDSWGTYESVYDQSGDGSLVLKSRLGWVDGVYQADFVVVDRATGAEQVVSRDHTGAVPSGNLIRGGAKLSRDGRYVAFEAVADFDRTLAGPEATMAIFARDLATGALHAYTVPDGNPVLRAVLDDGRVLVNRYLQADGSHLRPVIWDPARGATEEVGRAEARIIWGSMAITPDGRWLVDSDDPFWGTDLQVRVFDLDRPEVCFLPGLSGGTVDGARVAADGEEEPTPPTWGPFRASGCFTETGPGVWKAEGQIGINGLDLQPTGAGGSITFDANTGVVTSVGSVAISVRGLDVMGRTVGPFRLSEQVLDWQLDPANVPVSIDAASFGIPLDATAVVTAPAEGQTRIVLDAVLPDLVGGGKAHLDIRTDDVDGLAAGSLSAKVTGASLAGLAKLEELTFAYAAAAEGEPAGWRMSADIAGEGGGGRLEGGVTWDDEGELVAADLHVTEAALAGMLEVDDLLVTYSAAEGWTGHLAAAGTGDDAPSVDASFVYSEGALQSAGIVAERVDLLGVVRVERFDLVYDRATDRWTVSGRATVPDPVPGAGEGPTTLRAALDLREGVVHSASVSVADATLGRTVRVNRLALAYALEEGVHRWDGAADVVLPGPSRPRVQAVVAVVGGELETARAAGSDLGLPLGPGVVLDRATLDVASAPVWRIHGTAGIEAGPEVAGVPALAVDAAAEVTFDDPVTWSIRGVLRVVSVQLAEAVVRYGEDGRLTAEGRLDWSPGPVSVTAEVDGWATEDAFQFEGDATISVAGAGLSGRALASTTGLAGCATVFAGNDATVGAGTVWATGEVRTFAGACDLTSWEASPAAGVEGTGRRVAADGPFGFTVEPGAGIVAVRITGDGGVPVVVLHGPGGEEVPAGVSGHVVGGFVAHDEASDAVTVLLDAPAAGTWAVVAEPGSPPIASVEQAVERAAPDIDPVSVVDRGDGTFELSWSLAPVQGQVVTFVESDGEGGGAEIVATSEASGAAVFVPAAGPTGERAITALVTQDGVPRGVIPVGSYTAPGPTVPGAPTGVAAEASGAGSATVTWSSPGGVAPVTGYEVAGQPGGAVVVVPAGSGSAAVSGLEGGVAHTFVVRALSPAGPGPWSVSSNPVVPGPPTPTCDATAFSDIGAGHAFCGDITWLVEEGIANGYPDGTFRPTAGVSRQAIAAFLFRATGRSKTGSCAGTPFPDVGRSHAFCEEIAWLVAEGITNGYADGTFKPTATISRQAMAAFLFRLTGEEAGATCAATFPDVGTTHAFCDEIAWMVEEGITNGYPDGTFRPTATISRQAAAAFLHRSAPLFEP